MEGVQFVKISIETLLIAGMTLFVPCVSASWILLKTLVFNPINRLTNELGQTNKTLQKVVLTVTEAKGEILVINQWRVDTERRIAHIEAQLRE